MKFKELGLSSEMNKCLDDYGFVVATDIQQQAIPVALSGKDIIGQAQTGTGKTAAFGIPLIELTDVTSSEVQHLVVAPTRELAVQIAKELESLSKFKKVNVVQIFGGSSYTRQMDELKKKPHIVVGTPGRIIDMINKKKLKIHNLKSFTLDEADEMLAIGFLTEIKEMISYIPKQAQRFMFTATMNKKVQDIAKDLSDDPVSITVSEGMASTKNIKQSYIVMKENQKYVALTRLLDVNTEGQSVVFGRTKKRVEQLAHALRKCGYNAAGIQGDMTQNDRSRVMKQFKANEIDILIATDVAARGIDVKNVVYVYNFDLPDQVEYYTHRIGRCGRAGKDGFSVSFIRDVELEYIKHIEETTDSVIIKISTPSQEEAQEATSKRVIGEYEEILEKSKLKDDTHITKLIMERFTAIELAKIVAESVISNKKIYDIELDGEPPVRFNKKTKKATSRGGSGGGGRSRGNRSGGSRDRGSRDGGSRDRGSRDGGSRNRSSGGGNRSGGSRSGGSGSGDGKKRRGSRR